MKVIGKRKCCWSRSAPIMYTREKMSCANAELPEVFHGSQWVSLHRSLVYHAVQHPTAQRVTRAMEQTLLPDEAFLQTIAVNSPYRSTLIGTHLRFIEWPQLHGDANKYWASLGPRFHGGPMVLNESLMTHKAFLTSAMFARKVDPSVYNDVLPVWDAWMAEKVRKQDVEMAVAQSPGLALLSSAAPRQPPIGQSVWHADPGMHANVPAATPHEHDALPEGPEYFNPHLASETGRAATVASSKRGVFDSAAAAAARSSTGAPITAPRTVGGLGMLGAAHAAAAAIDHNHSAHAVHADDEHAHLHPHQHDEDDGHDHEHDGQSGVAAGFLFFWVAALLLAASLFVCRATLRELELGRRLGALRARLTGVPRGRETEDLKAF